MVPPAHPRSASTAARSAVPVPTPTARLLLSRFTAGPTPSLAQAVAGGREQRWFARQLKSASVPDPAGEQIEEWWPDLARTPLDLWMRQSDGTRQGWQVMNDYGSWVLTRRLRSSRQVLETMTAFFENLLYVPVSGDPYFTWRVDYGRTIRARALGRYSDLLAAAVLHPAMLVYLNAATSTKTAPNENLGRELLELHTVGVGNYSEDDVKDSARILTGWCVDVYQTWQKFYVPEYHSTGRVRVRGFTSTNRDADGRAVCAAYLRYLARHPDTAQRLATRLVEVFVSDDVPRGLVDRLARTYLDHDTAIAPVLLELVGSRPFRASAGAKLRTPEEDVVATYRALDIEVLPPLAADSATVAMLNSTGALGWRFASNSRPDGAPVANTAWASTARALGSLDLHWNLANRYYPVTDVSYRDPASWVPSFPITYGDLVDHLCRSVLTRRSTAELLQIAVTATGIAADTVIPDASHPAVTGIGRTLAALLDTPEHWYR